MRMMCIRGSSARRAHSGLTAGQVYEVSAVTSHPCACVGRWGLATAAGSTWLMNVRLRCLRCRASALFNRGDLVWWDRNRFAPWQDPKVSADEVRELYLAPPLKEKITKRKEGEKITQD